MTNSHLGQFAFSISLGCISRSEGSYVHLLSLFTHLLFMLENGLNNVEVGVDDDEERHEVAEEGIDHDV